MEHEKESKEGTKPSLSLWNKIEPHEDAEYYNRKFDMKSKAVLKELDLMKAHALKVDPKLKW